MKTVNGLIVRAIEEGLATHDQLTALENTLRNIEGESLTEKIMNTDVSFRIPTYRIQSTRPGPASIEELLPFVNQTFEQIEQYPEYYRIGVHFEDQEFHLIGVRRNSIYRYLYSKKVQLEVGMDSLEITDPDLFKRIIAGKTSGDPQWSVDVEEVLLVPHISIESLTVQEGDEDLEEEAMTTTTEEIETIVEESFQRPSLEIRNQIIDDVMGV